VITRAVEYRIRNWRWLNLFRSASQILAGAKVTAAFITFLGFGQISRWLSDVFYPFTRILWGDLFLWLNLPDISAIEKDALTALLFFVPLAVSSLLSKRISDESAELTERDRRTDWIIAILFAMLFFVLICGSLLVRLVDRVPSLAS